MCDVHCTAQICHSWDSLGIEGAGVRKCLSLSEGGDILMSDWVVPYFSPGRARVVFILGICSPLLGSCQLPIMF